MDSARLTNTLNVFPKFLIVFLFLVLAIVQADKKFVLDEVDFPIVSKATSLTGTPVYYRGESNPNHLGIYHPPLYINALALFIKLFGDGENVIRTFGMICTLTTSLLIILIFREIHEKKNEIFDAVFLGLFLLNPYTLANTTLPDIDSTVLPLLISFFLFCSIKYFRRASESVRSQDILIVGVVFALCLWAKLTTPLILPAVLMLLLVGNGNSLRRSLAITFFVIVVGSGLFGATYWLYCKSLGLPMDYTFKFLLHSFTKGTTGDSIFSKVISNLKYTQQFIYWLTIPTSCLSLFGIYHYIWNVRVNRDKSVLLLGLFGGFVTLFYLCLIAPFGGFFKYPYAVFSFVLIPVSVLCSELFKIEEVKFKSLLVFTFAVLVSSSFYSDEVFLRQEIFTNTALLFLLLVILSVTLFLIKKTKLVKVFVLVLLYFSLSMSLGISRTQAVADYPTKYYYGQNGFEDAVNYLKGRVGEDEVIWSMKDIGYYVNNRYVENYGYFFSKELQSNLSSMIREGKIRFYVSTIGIGEDRIDVYSDITEIFDANCGESEAKVFGNFKIYYCGRDGN